MVAWSKAIAVEVVRLNLGSTGKALSTVSGARKSSVGGGVVISIISKVCKEKCEIRGKKDTMLCVPGIIWIRGRQSQKPGIMTAGASGVIRGTIFGPGKKIVLSFNGTVWVLQGGICLHAKASREAEN